MTEPEAAGSELRFGPFVLDRGRAELRRNGETIALPPQPFRVLTLLASRADKLVTREEIQTAVWGGATVVDFDRGLNTCIRQIRSVLGDSAEDSQYVRTVPRLGYRFVAPVSSGGNGAEAVGNRNKGLWRQMGSWNAGVVAARAIVAVVLFLFFLLVGRIVRGCHAGEKPPDHVPAGFSGKMDGGAERERILEVVEGRERRYFPAAEGESRRDHERGKGRGPRSAAAGGGSIEEKRGACGI